MAKKSYTRPTLVDRGSAIERTLETDTPNALEIDLITRTRGSAL